MYRSYRQMGKRKEARGTVALPILKKLAKISHNQAENRNLVPRVFLRHTPMTKPNEHPGTLRSNVPRIWVH